ncbi:M56 family metallopeptidase [Paenibacillus sp. 1P07SE]|uniref:M56 family metallopeptidase n=1 Tax=Paenibacillus sp. 1P07SE TaxID=3132209 RepID=UPI0039A5B29C
MQTLFLGIVNMSVTASYVIAAVLLIRLLLKRAPKKYAYLLWAVVLFRLVCPVSISSELSLFNVPSLDMSVAQRESASALSYVPQGIGEAETPSMTVGIPQMNAVINESLPPGNPAASVNPMQVVLALVSMVWAAGTVLLLGYGLVSYLRLKKRMATAVRLGEGVYESDRIGSPFILGFIRPRIYIPFGLGTLEREYILMHEAYHLKRKDHLIKPVAFAVLALHWFNPLVWVAFSRMARDMEMSCDEQVLAKGGSAMAKDYCTTLLAFATNRRLPTASPLAFGESGIRERVRNVLRYRKPGRSAVFICASVCLFVSAACATNPLSGDPATESVDANLYGSYSFDRQVYMNPLSSFYAGEDYEETYTLAEHSLIITGAAGQQRTMAVAYARETVDEHIFGASFSPAASGIGIPDISGYKERYRYVLTEADDSPGYHLYLLDDEIWLAQTRKSALPQESASGIWSIFRIVKLDDTMPVTSMVRGSSDDIDDFLAAQGAFDSGYGGDSPYNITPEAMASGSDYRIFKYAASSATFLLHDDEVYPLGEWFGGMGLTSMALADLDKDGEPELYFTYSWGSGMHRSHAAYYDPTAKRVELLEYTHLHEDMMLDATPDGRLSLRRAMISNFRSFVDFDITGSDVISDIVYADGAIVVEVAASQNAEG